MLSPKTLFPHKYLTLGCLAIALTAASAQEPERKPEVPPVQGAEQKATPAEAEKVVPPQPQAPKPEPVKASHPQPERKGGIQNVGAPKNEKKAGQNTGQNTGQSTGDKGSTANLGTDVVAVRQRIEAALSNDPTLRGTAFNLNVTDDTIEITGVANSGRDRTAARRIVQSFAGNLRVKDRITVTGAAPPIAPPDSTDKTDKPNGQANTEADALAKPESDEQLPQKKANKPKKDPPKHGDQAEDPR
ncbi:MAG: BON domain-containing protein [Terriglobales bacterium]